MRISGFLCSQVFHLNDNRGCGKIAIIYCISDHKNLFLLSLIPLRSCSPLLLFLDFPIEYGFGKSFILSFLSLLVNVAEPH